MAGFVDRSRDRAVGRLCSRRIRQAQEMTDLQLQLGTCAGGTRRHSAAGWQFERRNVADTRRLGQAHSRAKDRQVEGQAVGTESHAAVGCCFVLNRILNRAWSSRPVRGHLNGVLCAVSYRYTGHVQFLQKLCSRRSMSTRTPQPPPPTELCSLSSRSLAAKLANGFPLSFRTSS